MRTAIYVSWLFILLLLILNSRKAEQIEELQNDVSALQQDVQGAYEALNNIQNSATNITVFSDTYESD